MGSNSSVTYRQQGTLFLGQKTIFVDQVERRVFNMITKRNSFGGMKPYLFFIKYGRQRFDTRSRGGFRGCF